MAFLDGFCRCFMWFHLKTDHAFMGGIKSIEQTRITIEIDSSYGKKVGTIITKIKID